MFRTGSITRQLQNTLLSLLALFPSGLMIMSTAGSCVLAQSIPVKEPSPEGKSTLGAALAVRLKMPFLELDRLIEQGSGLTMNLLFDFRGQAGFRELERRFLEDALQRYPCFALATGGSLVSEPGTFERLLASCFTVWVRTSPEEHMQRVIAQGDMRPMANNRDAMSDLKRILAEREVLYSKADIQIDTAGRSLEASLETLIQALRNTPVRESLAPTVTP